LPAPSGEARDRGARWYEDFTPQGFSKPVRYEYVRVFSKSADDHGDDPGAPPIPEPYYGVTTAGDWYILHLGGTKSVRITGWSTKSIPAWAVTARVSTWTGSSSGHGATPSPVPCRLLGGTSETVANGDHFELRASATPQASAGEWCLVGFWCEPVKPDPNGDAWHVWYVGFILQQ
jgi:hypothetical protein